MWIVVQFKVLLECSLKGILFCTLKLYFVVVWKVGDKGSHVIHKNWAPPPQNIIIPPLFTFRVCFVNSTISNSIQLYVLYFRIRLLLCLLLFCLLLFCCYSVNCCFVVVLFIIVFLLFFLLLFCCYSVDHCSVVVLLIAVVRVFCCCRFTRVANAFLVLHCPKIGNTFDWFISSQNSKGCCFTWK